LVEVDFLAPLYCLHKDLGERGAGKIDSVCAWAAAGGSYFSSIFVLAMEVLTLIVVRVAEGGLLGPVARCAPKQRISIYADDVALFLKPKTQDLVVIRGILEIFGEASGLNVNYNKSSAIVIRGEAEDTILVKHLLRCEIGSFPCKYLGLQLSPCQIRKADWQPVLDQVLASMPTWWKGLLARSGRLTLIKAVILARPVHQLLVADAPAWLLEEINRWIRAFFWAGKDHVSGGQCLIAWQRIC
jgi:hypothetical protein